MADENYKVQVNFFTKQNVSDLNRFNENISKSVSNLSKQLNETAAKQSAGGGIAGSIVGGFMVGRLSKLLGAANKKIKDLNNEVASWKKRAEKSKKGFEQSQRENENLKNKQQPPTDYVEKENDKLRESLRAAEDQIRASQKAYYEKHEQLVKQFHKSRTSPLSDVMPEEVASSTKIKYNLPGEAEISKLSKKLQKANMKNEAYKNELKLLKESNIEKLQKPKIDTPKANLETQTMLLKPIPATPGSPPAQWGNRATTTTKTTSDVPNAKLIATIDVKKSIEMLRRTEQTEQ